MPSRPVIVGAPLAADAQREQVAATARGEAEKILVVKKAEAEAESKALQGQGIANQRRAIIQGLQGSIEQFQKVVGNAPTSEVMQLVLVTQYFDTLKTIGESDKTNTLFSWSRQGYFRSGLAIYVDRSKSEGVIMVAECG
jgi:regulator of protease activity HflC (stomatin/prohibitin superfamily)